MNAEGRINAPQETSAYVVREPERNASRGLTVTLSITDPEVVAELGAREGEERERFALAALRIGVLSLRTASGSLDAHSLQEAGQKLLGDVRELLAQRGESLTGELSKSLATYLDPRAGAFPQRLEALLKRDGELDRLLRAHVGPEDSVLARALTQHLGDGSPIFRLLSPTDANGLKAQVEKLLVGALGEQRDTILKQFSLDAKDSALSRLVQNLQERQTKLSDDLKGQVDSVVREFSLDNEDGALKRLVRSVELAQRQISAEFTTDNEQSALSRLQRMLGQTNESIHRNLTLDDDGSALNRLKRELQGSIEELTKRNLEFQETVKITLAELRAKKEADASAPKHGLVFEESLGAFLGREAERLNDLFEATGATTGLIKNSKKGDFVVRLGPDAAAPGATLVFEAKDVKGFALKQALEEIEEARKNRGAQLGVFVFSKKNAPEGLAPFARYGDALVIAWDEEDSISDTYVRAAYSTARALVVRQKASDGRTSDALVDVETATRSIEKQIGWFDEIRTQADNTKVSADKILKRVESMRRELDRQVSSLDEALQSMRTSEG
jgi:hypothetical protein